MFYLTTHSTHFIYGYMHHPTDRTAHTLAFVTPVVEHWLEREIAQSQKGNLMLSLYVLLFPIKNLKNGELYFRVHILSSFGHACSQAQPLAWPVTVSKEGELFN